MRKGGDGKKGEVVGVARKQEGVEKMQESKWARDGRGRTSKQKSTPKKILYTNIIKHKDI